MKVCRLLIYNTLGYGVTGNTADFGSAILGPNPGTPTNTAHI